MQRLDVRVPTGPWAASEARRSLAPLGNELDRATFEEVRLLVSELVTNSYRHALHRAGEQIEVHIQIGPAAVRVEVWDRGRGFRAPRFTGSPDDRPTDSRPERIGDSGWGLYIVDRVADRWGVVNGDFTKVWFEKDFAATAAAHSG